MGEQWTLCRGFAITMQKIKSKVGTAWKGLFSKDRNLEVFETLNWNAHVSRSTPYAEQNTLPF
jgi:hypothetical protein